MKAEELFELNIVKPDEGIYAGAKAVFDGIAKPVDGFGDFEDIICRIAAIRGSIAPDITKKAVIEMIADNGVVAEGVSQTDSSVTSAVAALMGCGRSTIGIMTGDTDISVVAVDVGIDSDGSFPGVIDRKVRRGTENIARESAMSLEECLLAISAGIDTVRDCHDKGVGLIATGEMGIGNTTTATALLCALTGIEPGKVTGRGAGLSDEALIIKTDVIKRALELHNPDKTAVCDMEQGSVKIKTHTLSMLAKVGGLDIAGLVGVYIGGAVFHIPVVIDGLISAVAALSASLIVPDSREYMIASHKGRESGTAEALSRLGLRPVIDADMALGEGTGAVMLLPVIDMIMNVYNSGTRFESAQISRYERFGR